MATAGSRWCIRASADQLEHKKGERGAWSNSTCSTEVLKATACTTLLTYPAIVELLAEVDLEVLAQHADVQQLELGRRALLNHHLAHVSRVLASGDRGIGSDKHDT